MKDVLALLKRNIEERMAALKDDVVGGQYALEDYISRCGEHRGLQWVVDELQALVKKHPDGISDLDDMDDDILDRDGALTHRHN